MRLSLLTLLLVLSSLRAFCTDGGKLSTYYNYIYLAESKVLAEDYKGAATAYDAAFSSGVIPFSTDIYNNLLVNINIKNNSKILKMAAALVLKGADTGYFKKGIFDSFRQSAEWKTLIKTYPSLKTQRDKNIDTNLIRQVKDMVAEDQRAAHIHQDNRIASGASGKYDQEAESAFNRVEDSVFAVLKKLMITYDYLSEEKIGANFTDTFFDVSPIYYVVLLHSFQAEHQNTLLATLKEAIHYGKIKSGLGMNYLSGSGPRTYNNSVQVVYLNDYYVFKDTLFKSVLRTSVKNYKTTTLNLLSPEPTKEEERFIAYCYIDKIENITKKLKFTFHWLINDMHNIATDPLKQFIFGPNVAGIINDKNRPEMFKDDLVISVYH